MFCSVLPICLFSLCTAHFVLYILTYPHIHISTFLHIYIFTYSHRYEIDDGIESDPLFDSLESMLEKYRDDLLNGRIEYLGDDCGVCEKMGAGRK